MTRSVIGFSIVMALLLPGLLTNCSEKPAPKKENSAAFSLAADSIRSDQEVRNDLMSPLIYKNVVLILGGSPSLGAQVSREELYSQKLQQRIEGSIKVLNASVASESAEPLKKRTPFLFKHDIQAVVLEMGYDEGQARLTPRAFRQKIKAVLDYEPASSLPVYLLLTADNQKYQSVIQDLASRYGLELLIPDQPRTDTQAWHDEVAFLLEKRLKIVR